MTSNKLKARALCRATALSGLAAAALLCAPAIAAAKDSVTVSVVLALAAGEWSTEILAGANAAAKDLGGKVKVRGVRVRPRSIRNARRKCSSPSSRPSRTCWWSSTSRRRCSPSRRSKRRRAAPTSCGSTCRRCLRSRTRCSSPPTPSAWVRPAARSSSTALEKSHNKPAADITGDVVTAVCVPGLTVLENRLGGEVAYLKKKMPKINVLASFDSKPDRERNFALWDQAIRKTPNALTYIDPCEEGEENIPKILENDKVKVPLVSYDSPEEVREDVAQGLITAVVPANFFSQAVSGHLHLGRCGAQGQAAAAGLGEGAARGGR